jgi:hypothetical protein
VMKNHHIANLTLEGEALAVTLCEYCVAGGVFDPIVSGHRYRFRVTGWYRSSPLMMDDVTGSLWSLVNAQPLQGPALAAGRLPKRPIVHATWAQWRAMYGDTWVVHGEGEPRTGHGAECFSPEHEVKRTKYEDTRVAARDLVVGVEIDGSTCAYPLDALHAEGGIVEDVLAGRPIVVVGLPGTWMAVSFERELEGVPLELSWDESEEPRRHLVDAASGSRFDLWGLCVDGPHAGQSLSYVPSALKKWMVWAIVNPGSRVWGLDASPTS